MDEITQSTQPAAREFLEAAYTQLDYQRGALLDSVDTSQVSTVDADEWLEKGNWLELGKKIKAEKIFFVSNDPVIVFRAFTSLPSESEILTAFRQTWCMTRSQYLFLALPGELRVYGLRQFPLQSEGDPKKQLTCKIIKRIADVSVELNAYRREQLEAGYFPDDRLFGKADEQADKRLINDLKEVRKQLREINDLKLEFAHVLIGRSIFIRYLEDRKVLLPAYFEQVAAKHQRDDWLKLLDEQPPHHLIQDKKWQERRYYQVLQDKDFTCALFEQLAEDFNGDLFPKDAAEKEAVTPTHLLKLRRFLVGDTDPRQPTLWLWAYDFEIIPIELISSIYEEFYKNEQDDPGTHYTPNVLVEFALSQVLPQACLEANSTVQILDPACGSGIFLVEAYRRLVRYKMWKEGCPLSSVELREILRDQIRGIELNKNATNVGCTRFNWSIGDNELSQAFIARTLNLLKPGGLCGLLVKVTVFLTHYDASQKFRQRWLTETTIKRVFNFTHVKQVFFETAIAPFAFVYYKLEVADINHRVSYWSAKRTKIIKDKPGVILHLSDIRQIQQRELHQNYQLWKVYWWGNHRDASLVNVLQLESPLVEYIDCDSSGMLLAGRGFEGNLKRSDKNPGSWLQEYQFLPTRFFESYGTLSEQSLNTEDVPDNVHRSRESWLYNGWRLLIKRGITQAHNINGAIKARLEKQSFCYRHSIYGVRVDNLSEYQRKILLAIVWSNLTRYYLFLTSGSWGTWHHEIYLSNIKQLPIRFPDDLELRNRIVTIVDKLRNWDTSLPLFNQSNQTETIESLECQLDEAIFDLYELNEAERDLVLDMCETGLEFFYRHSNSNAVKRLEPYPQVKQGFITDLPRQRYAEKGLEGYLYAFLDMWQSCLEPDGVFRWRVVRPDNDPMVAIVFNTQSKHNDLPC